MAKCSTCGHKLVPSRGGLVLRPVGRERPRLPACYGFCAEAAARQLAEELDLRPDQIRSRHLRVPPEPPV